MSPLGLQGANFCREPANIPLFGKKPADSGEAARL
jgi:hypothetical protein